MNFQKKKKRKTCLNTAFFPLFDFLQRHLPTITVLYMAVLSYSSIVNPESNPTGGALSNITRISSNNKYVESLTHSVIEAKCRDDCSELCPVACCHINLEEWPSLPKRTVCIHAPRPWTTAHPACASSFPLLVKVPLTKTNAIAGSSKEVIQRLSPSLAISRSSKGDFTT